MLDDIRCRGGLNIVRDSKVTCDSVPQYTLTTADTAISTRQARA